MSSYVYTEKIIGWLMFLKKYFRWIIYYTLDRLKSTSNKKGCIVKGCTNTPLLKTENLIYPLTRGVKTLPFYKGRVGDIFGERYQTPCNGRKIMVKCYKITRKEGGRTMELQESGEMYLETILILLHKNGFVRSVDVCEYMGYSKPSVSRAVSLLKKGGYIEVDGVGGLHFTRIGLTIAKKIYDRHKTITEFLTGLGVPEKVAAEDACRIEHVISDKSFAAIKKSMKNK